MPRLHPRPTLLVPFVLVLAAALLAPPVARAHCDGLDGPVVKAAQAALEANDVNRILIWVQPPGEEEIRAAFAHAVAVRKLGPQARELADRYLFETLVRVHRAGEGEPYTGLKPAGRDLGPAIPAADRAIETGDPTPLLTLLHEAVVRGMESRFHEAIHAKKFAPADLAAGRKYVASYVTFLHYVEGLHQAAAPSGGGHGAHDAPGAVHEAPGAAHEEHGAGHRP